MNSGLFSLIIVIITPFIKVYNFFLKKDIEKIVVSFKLHFYIFLFAIFFLNHSIRTRYFDWDSAFVSLEHYFIINFIIIFEFFYLIFLFLLELKNVKHNPTNNIFLSFTFHFCNLLFSIFLFFIVFIGLGYKKYKETQPYLVNPFPISDEIYEIIRVSLDGQIIICLIGFEIIYLILLSFVKFFLFLKKKNKS